MASHQLGMAYDLRLADNSECFTDVKVVRTAVLRMTLTSFTVTTPTTSPTTTTAGTLVCTAVTDGGERTSESGNTTRQQQSQLHLSSRSVRRAIRPPNE